METSSQDLITAEHPVACCQRWQQAVEERVLRAFELDDATNLSNVRWA